VIEQVEPGTPVVAAPWCSGQLPAPEHQIHRWSHRDQMGLGVTLCGVRQEDRGNGWVLLEFARKPGRWTVCMACIETWGR
jgi:hypothetical protein